MEFIKKYMVKTLIGLVALGLVGCGSITGLPGHGGGKRFLIEQKLVSATARAAIKDVDVSPLLGHRVTIIFDSLSDEGGGNLVGGRFSLRNL